jgi:hypothetical protein
LHDRHQRADTRPTRNRSPRTPIATVLALVLAGAPAACNIDAVSGGNTGADAGVFYALGDDHRLYRWDPDGGAGTEGSDQGTVEQVLDLSSAWDGKGDIGTVLRASLSIDPSQRHAAWIAGANPEAALMLGDLDTGEIATAAEYPVDHACIDPTWLADGSALLTHRAPVWGGEAASNTTTYSDEIPLPIESWGPTEWYSPEAGQLPTTVELHPQGCRLRWYTAEDGSAQAIYHNLELTELYRIDVNGQVLETIRVPSLEGTESLMIGLVNVDPTGRYACVVDGYGPHGASKGGFTFRAETGTRVIDIETGEAVRSEDTGCTTLHQEGFVSREGASVTFISYEGIDQWATELPDQIGDSPVLYFFPNES